MTPHASSRAAVLISVLALVVALGGTGYAAVKIGGDQIKNNAITSPKVKNDSLTGSDVDESKLGAVPQATDAAHAAHADTADTAGTATSAGTATNAQTVNGMVVTKVEYNSASTSAVVLYSGGGLTIRAACFSSGSDLALAATTSKVGSSLYTMWRDLEDTDTGTNDYEGGSFPVGPEANLLLGATTLDEDPALVWFNYDVTDGTTVTGQLSTDTNTGAGGLSCAVNGTVTRG